MDLHKLKLPAETRIEPYQATFVLCHALCADASSACLSFVIVALAALCMFSGKMPLLILEATP